VRVEDVKERLIKTALRSTCKYRVAAIGLNARGTPISSAYNTSRIQRKGGGFHAEALVMRKSPPSLKTILICRLGMAGEIRPIHPCPACKRLADKLGIKIRTVER